MKKEDIIRLIREEYENRLSSVKIAATIAEAQLEDKRGNTIISKDLKVKHKARGYEYTVDKIKGEGEEMVIFLRNPEVPRVTPADIIKRMNEIDTDGLMPEKINSSEIEITDIELPDGESLADLENQKLGDIFMVTAKEFKKDYIID